MKKKLLFAFLGALLLALLCGNAMGAVNGTQEDPWLIGPDDSDTVTAWLSGGTLTISGTGDMQDWGDEENVPWYSIRETITAVSFESGSEITGIGAYAFFECYSLASITIPESVTGIGAFAFCGCDSLTGITIPESVTSIGRAAFYDCISLTGITIPESVTSIGEVAFSFCNSLQTLSFSEPRTEDLTIDPFAFDGCKSLTELSLPENMTVIGDYAFQNCEALKTVTLPESLETVSHGAFYVCGALETVTVKSKELTIGKSTYHYTFLDGFRLDGKTIRQNQDANAHGKTTLTVSSSGMVTVNAVPENGYGLLPGSLKLNNAAITGNTVDLADYSDVSTLTFSAEFVPVSGYCGGEGDGTNLTWAFNTETGVLTISGSGAMQDWSSEESVPWYSSKSNISSVVFASESNVTSIGKYAFCYCENLTNITIPESVTSIGNDAFYCCYHLTSITIPKSVTRIGETAFADCYSLQTLSFSESQSDKLTLGSFAFLGCALTELLLPENTTVIGEYAFQECRNLKTVTLPESLTTVSDQAFLVCKALETVTIKSKELTIQKLYIYTFPTGFKLDGKTIKQNQEANAHGKTTLTVNNSGKVTVSVTADNGYDVAKVSYTVDNGSETEIEKTNNAYTFDLPDGQSTVTVSAAFKLKQYTITWKDGNGDTLKTESADHGTTPAYSGETPTKKSTDQYDYTFKTWDPAPYAADQDQVYTAQFDENLRKYTITFVNEDGTKLQSSEVAYGETPSYTGNTPTKTEDADNIYTFKEWKPAIAAVTGEATYTAAFTANAKTEYTVIWQNGDGTELDKKTYKEGAAEPTTDKTPTKAEDEDNTYAFDKWDGGTVNGTVKTYKPVFTATAKDKPEPAKTEYTVIWLDGDGSELDKKTYKEGEAEPTTDKTPTKAEDEDNTYAFDKWDGGTVSGTVKTYKPFFTATAKDKPEPAKTEYTVIWLDGDGSELDRKTYKEGEAEPTTDKVPTKAADEDNVYTFSKWDGGSTEGNVKTYKPVFNATPKTQYTVIWLNGDGTELDRKTYKEGSKEPATDKVPVKAEDEKNTYTFSKWDGGSTEGNVKTYKPLFTAKAKPAPKPAEPNWWYAPENPPAAQPGLVTRVTVDKGIYQLYENTGTAMLVGITSEKIKELNIPATVSANGRTYKVTEIDGKVCQKLKKLKTVVFGKYIRVIGRKAFYQCAKLRTLIFRGKKLKSVGEKAFEGIHKKAEATVPGGRFSLYKKLLLDAGFPESGEIGK